MSARVDAAHFIPGNDVTEALSDLEVAVRANPGFTVICVGTDAGLSRVFNSALYFTAAKPKSNCTEI